MTQLPPKSTEQQTDEIDSELMKDLEFHWSKKSSLILLLSCVLLSLLAVFGFFFYKEYQKRALPDDQKQAQGNNSYAKTYTNDYWGFRFTYPPAWYPVIGSYDEGDYFFASEPVNFLSEVSNGGALLEVKTFNNLKQYRFSQWLSDQEQNYIPLGQRDNQGITNLNGNQMAKYILQPKKAVNNMNYLDMRIISKDDKKMYEFILESHDQVAHDNHAAEFEQILQSVNFYSGFGT